MRIYLSPYCVAGWVAADDVTVSNESGGPDPVVVNPGFEGSSGWSESPSSSFPGTSFYRSTWGTATPRSGDSAYALGNQLYGYLKSDHVPVSPGVEYDLSTYIRGEIDPDDDHYGGWLVSAHFYNGDDRIAILHASRVRVRSMYTPPSSSF